MTAFAGIVTFEGAAHDIRTEEQIGRALTTLRRGHVHTRHIANALFVQLSVPPPFIGDNATELFAADARLDNRAELAAALAISPAELARTGDGALIFRMYRRWGETGIARCLGAFAFALWDAQARRLILGRDCLGNRALFFHRGDGFVTFASGLGALLAMPRVPRELDELTLANFLVINLGEARRTFYRGIERVPSRTLVTIGSAELRHRHYWSPDIHATAPYRRDEEYIERARELFDQAVAAATADTPHVAIATGGLDSSAIAATVARQGRAESITCYTMVPPAGMRIDVGPGKYLDERDKIDALARMHPSLTVRYLPERPHPYEEDNSRLFARAHMPLLGPANLGSFYHVYDAVGEAGHQSMLFGGLGNFGLTWWGSFSLLALLRTGQWATFARDLAALARQDGRGLPRALAGEVVMPGAPFWLRHCIYRLRGRDPDDVARYSALNPDFIAEHDLAQRWRKQRFDPWFGAGGWNAARRRAYMLFDHNQFARDFTAMSQEMRGFDIRDPHGDRRLLEFLLAVPEPLYRRNGVDRSFARAVLADRLPPEILQERRRGANGPAWFRRLDVQRAGIAAELERLEASPLARRLIDLPRLKNLVQRWPDDEHAAEKRLFEFRLALSRGIHVGRFIRWVEGGNA